MVESLPAPAPDIEPGRRGRRCDAFLSGEWSGIGPAVLRLLLLVPSLLFGLGAVLRSEAYRVGLLPSRRLPVPTISVGNLVVGGTGKTPLVRLLCRRLLARGERPLVLARGYGARAAGDSLDEEGRSLARDLPEVLVVQGRDRAAAVAPFLEGPERPTVVILDDGTQHRRLRRDLEIVLVDARRPFANGLMLPAGPLREPPRALRRADLVVATRAGVLSETARRSMADRLEHYGRGIPVLTADHRPARLLPDGESPDALAGRRVHLVAGIAHPRSFLETVRALGAEVCGMSAFRDHHAYGARDLAEIAAAARTEGAELIVATGKDAPKLSSADLGVRLVFLEIEVELPWADAARLDDALRDLLAEPRDGH